MIKKNLFPTFHDGHVYGLISEESEVSIYAKTLEGEKYKLTFKNVEALRADNFLQGNIVSDIEVWTPAELSEADELLRFVYGFEKITAGIQEVMFSNVKTRFLQSGKALVYLSASYGAEIGIVLENSIGNFICQQLD